MEGSLASSSLGKEGLGLGQKALKWGARTEPGAVQKVKMLLKTDREEGLSMVSRNWSVSFSSSVVQQLRVDFFQAFVSPLGIERDATIAWERGVKIMS